MLAVCSGSAQTAGLSDALGSAFSMLDVHWTQLALETGSFLQLQLFFHSHTHRHVHTYAHRLMQRQGGLNERPRHVGVQKKGCCLCFCTLFVTH